MVGFHAMAPAPIDLADRIADPERREEEEERVMERFEKIGLQIMHRSRRRHDGRATRTRRRSATARKRKLVARRCSARRSSSRYNTVKHNREGTELRCRAG